MYLSGGGALSAGYGILTQCRERYCNGGSRHRRKSRPAGNLSSVTCQTLTCPGITRGPDSNADPDLAHLGWSLRGDISKELSQMMLTAEDRAGSGQASRPTASTFSTEELSEVAGGCGWRGVN